MMKNIFCFLKNKKGSHAIEAILITPIWLMVILFCIYMNAISSARQTLADESSAIVNIVAMSETEDKAREEVVKYIQTNHLEKKFTIEGGSEAFLAIQGVNHQPIPKTEWKKGTPVYLYITINTAFTGINFNSITIGDNKIKVFTETFTNECLLILDTGGKSNV